MKFVTKLKPDPNKRDACIINVPQQWFSWKSEGGRYVIVDMDVVEIHD